MESNNGSKNRSAVNWPTFIVGFLSLVGSGIGCWVTMKEQNATQEIRILNLEIQQNRIEAKMDKISDKLDDISIIVANKQDRK